MPHFVCLWGHDKGTFSYVVCLFWRTKSFGWSNMHLEENVKVKQQQRSVCMNTLKKQKVSKTTLSLFCLSVGMLWKKRKRFVKAEASYLECSKAHYENRMLWIKQCKLTLSVSENGLIQWNIILFCLSVRTLLENVMLWEKQCHLTLSVCENALKTKNRQNYIVFVFSVCGNALRENKKIH